MKNMSQKLFNFLCKNYYCNNSYKMHCIILYRLHL